MSSFQERQKDLFNHLKQAEDQCGFSKLNQKDPPPDYGVIDRHTYRRVKHEMKQFRGRESIFKRPEARIRDCLRAKTIPDHIKNPQKYVYYSLSDVTPEQMSDATNTATALAVMRRLEDQQLAEDANVPMEQDTDDSVFKKPKFCLSAVVKKDIKKEDEKIVFKSGKVIMPEYVVGVSQKKLKKEPPILVKKNKDNSDTVKKVELKLEHLFEEEE